MVRAPSATLSRRVERAMAGFSLVELMCAIFVVTAGGFGALQLYMTAIERTGATHDYTLVNRALVNEIETRRALPFDALLAGEGQAFLSAGPVLEGLDEPEATVSVVDRSPGTAGLKEVRVRIEWTMEHRRRVTKELVTLIARKE